ncbi:MAG: hypothetical protein NC111_01660 [Bacteroides sp.]|nr:hypothetical protein [Bacteroides sp.]MCM1413834.1 hypothetical protein [Bacteroides sp.]MCM1471222.1 hypothetical protein [Bacteroides sp.]
MKKIILIIFTALSSLNAFSQTDYWAENPNKNVTYTPSNIVFRSSQFSETVTGILECTEGTFSKGVWVGVSSYVNTPLRPLSSYEINLCGVRWATDINLSEGKSMVYTGAVSLSFMTIGTKYLVGLYTLENDGKYWPIPTPGIFTAGGSYLAGIDLIEEDPDNSEPEWYTIHGQRVSNPQGGVFIKKTGSLVEKVVVP